ncbi:hypothetical protein E3E26_06885 [Thermococcus sp. LS1]|uniref:hypothetical protein n=1 Tax=Thermococcus sp. LS1 TaxID=1638259 RepID=UPI0014390AAF|nr:hypothetical protein [Thermococcus sp. LS1]NJD99508.1 hypothetical protein [Thermococcus sp. LS1]
MSESEANFWSWVAEEVKQARPQEGIEDVVAWLEAEKKRAEERRFDYILRGDEEKVAYWNGRLEVINEVLRKLRRVGA